MILTSLPPRSVLKRIFSLMLLMFAGVVHGQLPERSFPFSFTENGLRIENVDFGEVLQSSFHQRFIIIANNSTTTVSNVAIRISGAYNVSNCMPTFKPGESCYVVLNYKAPNHASWDRKWLSVEFTLKEPDGSVHTDSQRIPVVGHVSPMLHPANSLQ